MIPSSRIITQGNVATVHHAARMIRQSGDIARQNMLMNSRRSAVFFVVPETVPPRTTSLGLEVARTFTINQADVGDGVVQYELLEGDQVLWSGMGDDPAEGLLQIIIRLTGGDDPEDVPPDDRPE